MLFSSFAVADATEAFARHDQPVRMRRYATLEEGTRPRGVRRSQNGRFRVYAGPMEPLNMSMNGKMASCFDG